MRQNVLRLLAIGVVSATLLGSMNAFAQRGRGGGGGGSFGRSGGFSSSRPSSGSSFSRPPTGSSSFGRPSNPSTSASGSWSSSFGRSGSFGGSKTYTNMQSGGSNSALNNRVPPRVNTSPPPRVGGTSYNTYNSYSYGSYGYGRPVYGGGWSDYSFGWSRPSWYFYTPFHPAFYYGPPVYTSGAYYPGGFSFFRFLFGLILIGGVIWVIVKVVSLFRGSGNQGGYPPQNNLPF